MVSLFISDFLVGFVDLKLEVIPLDLNIRYSNYSIFIPTLMDLIHLDSFYNE